VTVKNHAAPFLAEAFDEKTPGFLISATSADMIKKSLKKGQHEVAHLFNQVRPITIYCFPKSEYQYHPFENLCS
jgi:hypothetical protein